ncbi:tetratricopeptide repeat protein [Sorangium sp. So ce367]|uniref:tetratricopeptide repeat protein n=1 Tax=Sorangium sp. So ce367 TaxID=3133305 RepID=UPI003F61479D
MSTGEPAGGSSYLPGSAAESIANLTDESEERLRALRRGLRRADRFALFVVLASGAARTEVLRRMRGWSGQEGLPTFQFLPDGAQGVRAVEELLETAGPAQPRRGIVVSDTASLLDTAEGRAIQALNIARDTLARVIVGPLVLVLSPDRAADLPRVAPDLFDVRSGTCEVEALPGATLGDAARLASPPEEARRPARFIDELNELRATAARLRETMPSSEAPPPAALADAWLNLGQKLLVRHYALDEALASSREARRLAEGIGYHGAVSAALVLEGNVAMYRGDLERSRKALEHGLEISQTAQDRLGEANCLKSLGDLDMRVSNLDAARASYTLALPVFREIRDRLGEANCLQSLGDLDRRVSNLDAARASYTLALSIFREIRARLGEANCLKSLGDLDRRVDDLDAARASYTLALGIFREIRDRLGEANGLWSLGDLDRRVDDLDAARASYTLALGIFREIRDRVGEANCLKSLGDLDLRVFNLDAARASYTLALPAFREIRDRLGEANCLKSLGDLDRRVDDLDAARASYTLALGIFREIHNPLGEANCLWSLGDLDRRVDDLDAARASYTLALGIFRKIRDRSGEANCLQSLGDLDMRVDDLDAARASYTLALGIFREIRNRSGEANCLQSLGDLDMRVDDLDAARTSYTLALGIFREIHERLGEANCLQSLGLLALTAGEPKEAFQRFLDVLARHREIRNQVGEQAVHGYLARTAAAVGAPDQALILAELSLDIGGRIQDRIGQSITLELQLLIFSSLQDDRAFLATALLLRDLCTSLREVDRAQRYAALLEQAARTLPAEAWADLQQHAEALRRAAIAAAAQRLKDAGRDPYALPSPPDATTP